VRYIFGFEGGGGGGAVDGWMGGVEIGMYVRRGGCEEGERGRGRF